MFPSYVSKLTITETVGGPKPSSGNLHLKIPKKVTFELKKPKLSEFKSSTEKPMKEPDILCKVQLRGRKYDFMMPPKSPILELHGRVLCHLRLGSIFTPPIKSNMGHIIKL